jgi:DNA (cytosine-5)-methyltransferase 1
MNGLDLFSGIGGISLALSEWVRPIAYCEIDPYCQAVLLSRISDRSIGKAPIWDDVTTLEARCLPRGIDIIYGGFPCQDISIARSGDGLEGKQSGLFFEILRLAEEIKPKFIFLENVPAITSRGGLCIVREIASLGYDCRWCVISAASVGATHKRERWFLLAHTKSLGQQKKRFPLREEKKQSRSNSQFEYKISNEREESPPPFLGMDDVISYRVDRSKALGNSVVPAQAKKAFKLLMGIK